MCLCGYSLLLSESTYLSVPPLFGPNPGVRLAREIRFFFFVLCFPSGSWWCRTPPAVGCAGLLWLAGCCISQYFRACRSSRAVHVLAPTPKTARACCVFSRAEREVPSFLSWFPWKTSASWLLPSMHRGRRNFLALVGISVVSFLMLEVQGCQVLFPHQQALFAMGEEGQVLNCL